MKNSSFIKFNFKTNIHFFLFISLVSVVLNSNKQVYSEANDSPPLDFKVEAVIPTTQIDQNKTFFYVKTEPSKEQILKVKVTSTSENVVKVRAYLANGITSEEATINYLPEYGKDSTLTNSIEEIAVVETSELELKPGETQEVSIKINPPNEHYDGIKLGAIYFQKDSEVDNKATINSKYSYRIGIVTSESTEYYNKGKTLNFLKANANLLRLQKTIALTLQNPEPQVINDFSMSIKIVEKDTGKVVKRQSTTNGSIAPNSQFTYYLNWGIDPIPEGKYIAKLNASSSFETWDLEKEFTISEDKAEKMNNETVFKLVLPNWFYNITILIATISVILSIYLFYRGKNWNELYKKIRSKKRRREKLNENEN